MTTSSSSLTQKVIQGRWIGKIMLILASVGVVWMIGNKAAENPILFVQQILNGLQLGFVYALIALGYTMVYGIVRLINFAHGDVFMIGAFVSYYSVAKFGLHNWPSVTFPSLNPGLSILIGTITVIIVSMIICAIMAITIERIAYKPLRDAPRISALITAVGISFFLEYFGALDFVFTPNFITYKRPFEVITYYINNGIFRLEKGMAPPVGSIIFSNIFII